MKKFFIALIIFFCTSLYAMEHPTKPKAAPSSNDPKDRTKYTTKYGVFIVCKSYTIFYEHSSPNIQQFAGGQPTIIQKDGKTFLIPPSNIYVLLKDERVKGKLKAHLIDD